jgi:rhamnosyl/mannosyltransferase
MACHPILKRALDKSSAIIASSPNYIETSPVLSAYPSRCHVIPFGIPIDNFLTADSTAVAAIREQYGSRLIVSVGRLVYYKGIEYLIEAMASIDAHLLIIGDGPLRGKLEAKAREHGVSDRVTMLGHVEDLTPYYHAADVFAFPSIARSEAFGIVQIEAMACGKPVVNTKLPSGVPFVSLDGETGFTVPPSDAGALSRALRLLLERDQLRLKFGAAARVRAEREFSVQRMTERTLQLYDRIHGRTTEQPAGEERFQRVSGL